MLCSCLSTNDSNIKISSGGYIAEIKTLLKNSKLVSAFQLIYVAEIMHDPVITRTEIFELWQETIFPLNTSIDHSNEEVNYFTVIAYSKISIFDSSKVDLKEFYLL